jgi:hypothetical protein
MYSKKEKKAPMSERQQMALLKAITAGKVEFVVSLTRNYA